MIDTRPPRPLPTLSLALAHRHPCQLHGVLCGLQPSGYKLAKKDVKPAPKKAGPRVKFPPEVVLHDYVSSGNMEEVRRVFFFFFCVLFASHIVHHTHPAGRFVFVSTHTPCRAVFFVDVVDPPP